MVLSENAISKFDAQRKTFENYGLNSLHQEFSFSEAAPVINARNQIVFGTDKGFIEISSKEMQKSSYIPPIVFTGLKVQGQSSVIAIDDLKELRLTPSQRNVTFQFAALDYVDSKEIRYAYRLKGLEEEWHDGDKNRSASYINLPNGKYKLQIKSTNSDGVWMDNTALYPSTYCPLSGRRAGHGCSTLFSSFSLRAVSYMYFFIFIGCATKWISSNNYPISSSVSLLTYLMNSRTR